MSIQGSINNIVGGAERSIGVLKYFVNQEVPGRLAQMQETVDKVQTQLMNILNMPIALKWIPEVK